MHPERPLACRLYPLGRIAGSEGAEFFVEFEPHPQSEGSYGAGGTVAEFLAAQEAEPFFQVAERYYSALLELAGAIGGAEAAVDDVAPAAVSQPVPPGILDLDHAAGRMAARRGVPLPVDLEARLELHLAFLHEPAAGSALQD